MKHGLRGGNKDWGCGSLGECTLSIYKALDPFLKLHHHKKEEGMKERKEQRRKKDKGDQSGDSVSKSA